MSSPHTARSILDAFYAAERIYMSAPPDQRDFSGVAATIAPSCRLEQTPALPYAGTYFGPEGMQSWGEQMADYFSVVDVQNPEIFERDGSNRIVVLSTIHLRVRKTGEDLYYPFCQAVTVDLQLGQITEMRPFYWDVAGVNEALQGRS
ncbi:hypothetical protein BO94DRAFT_240254 [Aspergillus sclerotioniger CBS 115572]|uniref:SnoaL-like domain-containing protein n=1 Tax=Aspergillus sclerotioniger CBS 115572 TaxID=1450535 RepID=A0A317VGQ7_9EURO|nr:hypothetical protein BO94DRAFT_240254 [Aspergillus sclerotioniger CBS 115572]PWY73115.1 hypothetical protein BO94DRAFT_240254 [Aspergillus sclerotioniger CBS 115572]